MNALAFQHHDPDPVEADTCSECATGLTDDEAVDCGTHHLCHDCLALATCHECARIWDDLIRDAADAGAHDLHRETTPS